MNAMAGNSVFIVERQHAPGLWLPMSGVAYGTPQKAELVRAELLRSLGSKQQDNYRVRRYVRVDEQ